MVRERVPAVARPNPAQAIRSASPPNLCDVGALQRAIGNRATAGVLRAVSERRLQRYTVVGPANPGAPAAGGYQIIGGFPGFEAQTVAAPNINAPAAAVPAQVRVSDDGNMAVEDTTLAARQPKVFYAVPSVVTAANTRLAAVDSDFELFIDRPNALRVTVPGQAHKDLARVLPQTHGRVRGWGAALRNLWGAPGGHEGMALTVGADCINVAAAVMKHEGGYRQPRTGSWTSPTSPSFADFRVARYMATWVQQQIANSNATLGPAFWDWWGSAHNAARAEFANGIPPGQAGLDAIATDYANLQVNHPLLADRIARELGVNRYALPNVGEAYETYRIGLGQPPTRHPGGPAGGMARDFWAQHIAGVVAASGNDRVTLENYHREHEIGHGQADAPHYYFQMYGTNVGQSWHEAWTAGAVAAGLPPVGQPPVPGAPVAHPEALTTVVRSGPRSWWG